MLFPQFPDLLTNLCRTSISTLKGLIPTRRLRTIHLVPFPLANHLGALSHLRHSTPLVARVPFLLEGYFGRLADLRQTALIPIVGIVKSRVQLYIVRLLRTTHLVPFPLANHLGALSHLRHSTPLVARVPFLLEGYFGRLADLRQTALIPIVGIVKSRVQLYIGSRYRV
ncbi:hypothetical protein F2Q70_00010321 [Brassica cretica]|uniref:Uncharacterized protein n=1 Tax=Brassica cretica TaxID=69181 RepID=A0A8S9M6F5_BRACR|nr:hypothetical protein F2Q70_00010321 [Brassica cretica]